ncbi:N-glycosylase/DNA lyase [Candidatus Bilamarchaeum dharawalense]|uniref:8-oxoguanine DNA glycosylase/AP lyase n=1 Tax=Candidatus Bilamarchaeum dharawalense TaxID=2885759 RepID=A0A5E4LTN0_9ARCH|nr:N-glycosylase/DNA lyase [Candidatus Bilamarchaeum dharawalense]
MSLLSKIRLLSSKPISRTISSRLASFSRLGKQPNKKVFEELCFCLLTANYTSAGGIKIQKEIGRGFLSLSQVQLAQKLKSLGYRFPNTRARYIYEARKHLSELKILKTNKSQIELREWLASNVLGLGYKEASHFLRNTGYFDLAIIDFHILDLVVSEYRIKKPKSLSKTKYLEIEKKLAGLAKKLNMSQGELDLYLWYLETGKVLK